MNKRNTILGLCLALGATMLVVTLRANRESAPAPAATPEAKAARLSQIAAAGRVEPAGEEIKIGSEIDGRLSQVLVDEGDAVRKGQVIATLSNGDFAARVELARSTVEERAAVLERLRNGSRTEERKEAEARLREAESTEVTARAELDRRRSLLDRGAVSRSEFDQARRDAEGAAARVEAARERLALIRNETRAEDIRRAEAELMSARARLREAEALLGKTIMRSPIDGRVLRRYRKAGESVSAQYDTPVVALGDLSRLRVRVDVDEVDVARLRVGQPAYVTADAYGDARFTGRVVRIGQALGRKNVRTDEPSERVDTKILETLIELDPGQRLPVGLRVDAFLEVKN